MPNFKQALRDFVATSNSGKYSDEKVLMSKFPELKGYNIEVLRDFVATSNSGKYATEEELFSKFPEFNKGTTPVKKKFALDSSSEVGSSELPKSNKQKTEEFENAVKSFSEKQKATPKDAAGQPIVKPQIDKALKATFTKINNKVGSDKRISQTLGKINSNLIGKEEEEVVSQLSKDQTLKDLGFTFEESGALGDYVTVTAPDGKTTTEISLDNFLGSKSANQALALQKFIKDNTSKEKRIELDKIVLKEELEDKQAKEKKKKLGDIFDKQLGTKPKVEDSAYLKERLASIDTDLINETEENVVSEMEYQFGDLGFKFEKTGVLGDYMKVIAPNGKETEISLDNFLDSKSTKQAGLLKEFIKTNTPAKGLFVLENTLKQEDKKFNSQKQVDDSIKSFSKELNDLNSKQKQFLAKKAQLDKQIKENGLTEELQQQNLALREEMKVLLDEEETIKYKQRKLDAAVGKYTIMESKKGGWLGGITNTFFEGVGKISAGYADVMTNIAGEVNPIVKDNSFIGQFLPALYSQEDATKYALEAAEKMGLKVPKDRSQESITKFKKSLTEDQIDEIESYIRDKAKKDVKKDMLPLFRVGAKEIFGDRETTTAWTDLKKEGFWGGAILGVTESLPAMIGGNWANRTANMYAQISDGLAQEMENDPDFKDITENEKLAITLPIGITSAVLEQYGLRNIKASKGVISNLTMRALGKAGRGATAKTFRELVENEVESGLTRGLLTITAAGIAEFETGAAQSASETAFKAVYNEIKSKVDPVTGEEKKMFDTPDSTEDLIENILVSGAQEAVGGFVLGVPTAVSAAYSKKGFLKMDDVSFEAFEGMANDENMQTAYVTSLKNKVTQGIITMSDAKTQLNDYRNAAGLYRQLPEGLNTQQKKEAMNLLKEKRDLQDYVEGKDNALVVKQKERITEIDNSLTKLSETDAVQEQSTTEVPVQSETITSETMETGVPESRPEVVTEQAKKEEVKDFDLALPENKKNIIVADSSNGFILIDSETKNPIEVLNENAGQENVGISKPYATQEEAQARIEELKAEPEIVVQEEIAEPLRDIESTAKALNEDLVNSIEESTNMLFPKTENTNLVVSERYHKAKQDGTDPELVQAVENLLAPTVEVTQPQTIIEEQAEPQVVSEQVETVPVVEDLNLLNKKLKALFKKSAKLQKQYEETEDSNIELELNSVNEEAALLSAKIEELETATVVEEVTVPVIEEVNDLLELDTKDQTSLKRVLDYLDSLDSSLDLDPNELNDVTRVMAISTAKAVVKTLKALVKAGITLQEAIKAASEIHSVDDKDVLKAFDVIKQGGKQKSAPSATRNDIYAGAGRIISIVKDVTKITMREKDLLTKQIKDRAKGARESVQAWKEQSEIFAKELDELVKAGKINNKQVAAILKKFSKVNIFSEKSMNRFTDYMVKVFNDSNYKEKLATARKTLSSLKRLAKDETKNANLRAVASEFVKIDPSFVENIDEYNDIANRLETAVDGSKKRKSDVNFVETINVEDTISYVDKILVEQEAKIAEEKIKEIQDLLGVDASEFSAEEIDALLESEKEISDEDTKIVRATIKKAFDIYSSVIKEMISTGTDPFTEEEVTFDDKQKDIIERFMKIDPNQISDPKEALRTVDSLINFIQNKSTAGMLKPIADFEGIEGGEQVVKEGLKATRLRKYWSPKLGLLLGQKTTTLPVLFEKMFKGVNRALKFEELTGIADLINNSSKAESESNKIVKNYVKDFYKRKANGESFNSAYNDIERGVIAHVFRNVIGTESRMKKVFDRRKQEVLGAIDLLSNKGNESEQQTAEFLQKAYDKLLDGSESASDVKGKADINNVEAVEYWTNQWSNKYEALSDLALNFYNKVLGRDLNFTPDRIKKLQDKMEDIDLEDVQSQFFVNTDDILYDKKSGSLRDKQENRNIPKDMYVDFSFDKKNSNAMNDALTDLYTAFDIRKVGSFLKSKNFRKIFTSSKDANVVDKRIKKFVRLTRKKTPFSNDDISDFLKKADKLAKFGVTASLASPAQPFKQTIPVMFSTAMNAGSVGLGAAFNKDFNNWLNDLGFAISNRGVESQAEIDSLNKLLEKAADMPLDKALRFMEKTNDKALKTLLVNFDVWIARASFKAYYEQSLKKQGLKSSGINYSDHKTNKEAANYAQRMVDRQQNISNSALAGDLFTSDSASTKTLVKMLMPFSSFRSNQSARLGSDLSTLGYWGTSTKEDKIIALRSIMGYALESATYRSLQIGFSLLMYSAAKAAMGNDDDEEDEKFVNNLIKGASQSAFTDTFSPLPLTDPFMQDALAYTVDEIQSLKDIPEEERTKLFNSQEQSALKMLGTYGISLQKAKDIYSLGRLAYTKKYKDNYGKEKEISDEQASRLKKLIGPLFVASVFGVGSPDMTSIVNKSVKMSKKGESEINKKLLKEKSPETYERMYGEGSARYEIEQRKREIKKEAEERKNR